MPQFASCVRVLPQRKFVARNVSYVHVWFTYSEAIQMVFPSVAAPPKSPQRGREPNALKGW